MSGVYYQPLNSEVIWNLIQVRVYVRPWPVGYEEGNVVLTIPDLLSSCSLRSQSHYNQEILLQTVVAIYLPAHERIPLFICILPLAWLRILALCANFERINAWSPQP